MHRSMTEIRTYTYEYIYIQTYNYTLPENLVLSLELRNNVLGNYVIM